MVEAGRAVESFLRSLCAALFVQRRLGQQVGKLHTHPQFGQYPTSKIRNEDLRKLKPLLETVVKRVHNLEVIKNGVFFLDSSRNVGITCAKPMIILASFISSVVILAFLMPGNSPTHPGDTYNLVFFIELSSNLIPQ